VEIVHVFFLILLCLTAVFARLSGEITYVYGRMVEVILRKSLVISGFLPNAFDSKFKNN